MATRKKKTDVIMSAEVAESMEMPGTIGSAKIVFPTEPIVVKGSHLTVTTLPDGSTKLEWDDNALLRDVQTAIANYESESQSVIDDVKPKKSRKKKVAE